MESFISRIDGSIKDNLILNYSKKYYRYLKRQNARYYVNDSEIKSHEIVKTNTKIDIIFDSAIQKEELLFDYQLDIIYENDDFMIVDKDCHLNTIPSKSSPNKSLYNAIYTYLVKNDKLKTIHVITRLDKETSGLVLVALNKEAALLLNKNHDKITKIYEAVVNGNTKDEFIVEKSIKKSNIGIKREVALDGKYSKTLFRKYKFIDNKSYLDAYLYTGRTHQIRVHLASEGFPIIGDTLYEGQVSDRMLLNCKHIEFEFNNELFKFDSKIEF